MSRVVGFIVDELLKAIIFLRWARPTIRYVMTIVSGRDDGSAKTVCPRAVVNCELSKRQLGRGSILSTDLSENREVRAAYPLECGCEGSESAAARGSANGS